jgi:hypothetical protein
MRLLNRTAKIMLCPAFGFAASRGVISTLHAGCHFYLAPTVSFLVGKKVGK